MKSFHLLLFLSLLCVVNLLFGGTTGKIAGIVTDAKTGEPLPAVNIVVVGTRLGAATDMNGYYAILNVLPGNYTLKAMMMGYQPYTITDVRVKIEQTTNVDFKLKELIIEGEEVTVVAAAVRPIVDKDISSSQLNIESEQIEALPIQNIREAVSLQAGVLGLSVRGGGETETVFMMDGFTMRDERNNMPYTGISLAAIEAVKIQTGGFSAEYGNVRSGIVNVVTKEGDRDRYSGVFTMHYSPAASKHFGPSGYAWDSYWNRPYLDDAVCWTGTNNGAWDANTQRQYPSFEGWNAVAQRTLQDDDPNNDLTPEAAQRVFRYQHRKQGDIKDPDYTIDAGFGGPVPIVSNMLGDLRFFLSHRQEQDMYFIPLARDAYSDHSTLLKVTSNITPSITLTLSGLYGEVFAVSSNNVGEPGYFRYDYEIANQLQRRSYITGIMYGYDYWCPTSRYRHNFSAKLTHALSSKTFYEFQLEREGTYYNTIPNDLRDTTKVIKIGNNYWLDEAPEGYMPYPSSGIDGLRMGVGMSNSRDYSSVMTTNAKLHLVTQLDANNEIKTGLDFSYNEHHVEYGAIELTLPSGRPWSIWDKTPIRMGAYIEDKLEFKGMIANLGLRLDYSHAGGEWYDLSDYDKKFYSSSYKKDLESELTKLPTEKLLYLSPRLGVSHPITENSKLYFNYGHFRSMPLAERLYLIQRVTEGKVSQIGDPNNVLQKTVAYELGYDHSLFNDFLAHISAYYRDISDQPNWVRYISADRKVDYYRAEHNNYEDVRGFEISLNRTTLPNNWVSGIINYTYEVSTSGYFDKLIYYENPAEQRVYERDNIYQEKPRPRPYLKANIILHTPSNFGPTYYGFNPLSGWLLSFQYIWRAGQYATWTRGVYIPGIQDNVQWPDNHNLDLKLNRLFKVGPLSMDFFIEARNVLNIKTFSQYGFSDGNDYRDYFDSLLWPEEVGKPLGYTQFGDDKIGDLRPRGVTYEALEPNPNNDPSVDARNRVRRDNKSYIDNPNLEWLYYLNPRDIFFGVKINF